MPAIGVGGDMASPPEARGDEAHTPGNVSETQAGSGADRQVNVSTPESEKPADVYNEIADGQLPNDNEDVPQEREMIAKRENVHYPTWIMDNVIQVSSGDYHTMVIKEGGSLWGWGLNSRGSLGIGSTESQHVPVLIIDDVTAVSAGWEHTMAIRNDGSLWAWGSNDFGQLGDGTTEHRYSPVWIMDDVVSVTTSTAPDPGPFLGHTMAIKSDNSLWAWGANENGQLGDGTTEDRHSPIRVMEDVASAAAYDWSTIILKNDGSLWGFCRNWLHGYENGVAIDRKVHHWISDDIAAISDCGSMAIKNDGSLLRLRFWFYEDDVRTVQPRGYIVERIDRVAAASSGWSLVMVIRTDGSLWGWGNNWHGQLGVGPPTDIDLDPYYEDFVWIMDDVAAVSVGARHTMAIRTDGSLWAWGWNINGQLGIDTNKTDPTR